VAGATSDGSGAAETGVVETADDGRDGPDVHEPDDASTVERGCAMSELLSHLNEMHAKRFSWLGTEDLIKIHVKHHKVYWADHEHANVPEDWKTGENVVMKEAA
jgi:hypothetical protein